MTTKKIITVLLFLFMMTALLLGCGKKDGGEQIQATTVEESEIPTLSWWMVGGKPADYEAGMESINAYLEEKLGIHLEIHYTEWADWPEVSRAAVENGEYFDLMFVDTTSFNQYASMGALQDITDLIHRYAPELWKLIPEKVWLGARHSGRVYAVPTYKDSALCEYWIFDNHYIEKYQVSLEDLNTWADLDNYFRMLKEGEGEGFYPLLLSKGQNMNVFHEYDSFGCGLGFIGVRPDDSERRVICLLEEAAVLEKLDYLHQWYKEGIINPDANMLSSLSEPRSFFLGLGWPGAEVVWEQSEGIEDVVMKISFGPMYSRDSIQGAMTAVSANSVHQKEAVRLLELIHTDRKLRDMLAYGVEGVNFEYVDDNVVRKLDGKWEVLPYTQGSFFNMSVTEENAGIGWEGLKKNNEEAEESVLLEFEVNMDELGVEVAACEAVWSEYVMDLTTGAVNPKTAVPECLKRLKENGLDTIISEAQKQIDAFYKTTAVKGN